MNQQGCIHWRNMKHVGKGAQEKTQIREARCNFMHHLASYNNKELRTCWHDWSKRLRAINRVHEVGQGKINTRCAKKNCIASCITDKALRNIFMVFALSISLQLLKMSKLNYEFLAKKSTLTMLDIGLNVNDASSILRASKLLNIH